MTTLEFESGTLRRDAAARSEVHVPARRVARRWHRHRGHGRSARAARARFAAHRDLLRSRRDRVRRQVLPRARQDPRLARRRRREVPRRRCDFARCGRLVGAGWCAGDDGQWQDGRLVAGDRQPHPPRSLRERSPDQVPEGHEARHLWQIFDGVGPRERRHGDHSRGHRRPVLGHRRARHRQSDGSARDHAARLGARDPQRVRALACTRPRRARRWQEARDLHREAQRAARLPAVRERVQGNREGLSGCRGRARDRRCVRDVRAHPARALRRVRDDEHVRRHRHRPRLGAAGGDGHGGRLQCRRQPRDVRTDPRLGTAARR